MISDAKIEEAVQVAIREEVQKLNLENIAKLEVLNLIERKIAERLTSYGVKIGENLAQKALDDVFVPVNAYGQKSEPTTAREQLLKAALDGLKRATDSVRDYPSGSWLKNFLRDEMRKHVDAFFEGEAQALKAELVVLAAERLQASLKGGVE